MISKNPSTLIFRKLTIASLLIMGLISQIGCSKSSTSEKEQMIAYATKNNITYVSDPSGVLYQIITAGNSNKPKLTSTITVTYTGKLMSDKTFDLSLIHI